MKLEIGQTWVSDEYPHENFKIYDGVIDTTCESVKDFTLPFEEQPDGSKIFFWERINGVVFMRFVAEKKGENAESTYPYAWCGEVKKGVLQSKIKKYNMKLLNQG